MENGAASVHPVSIDNYLRAHSFLGPGGNVRGNESAPNSPEPRFLGGWILDHGLDGIYLDGYLDPDLVHIGPEPCHVVDRGQYAGPLVHMDAPESAHNLAPS